MFPSTEENMKKLLVDSIRMLLMCFNRFKGKINLIMNKMHFCKKIMLRCL